MKRALIGLFFLGLGAFLIAQQPVLIQNSGNNATVTAGGNLNVSATQVTSPWVDNVTQWAGSSLGAMANYGTSPGAVLVPGMNAFITNTPTVTANAGTGTFNIQSNASVNVNQWAGTALGAPSNYGTSPGAVEVNGVNAFITNTPTVIANAGTGTFAISGTVTANQGTATDPCQNSAKTYVNISQTANTQLITGAASKKTYVCYFWIAPIGTATNIALVEGTGTTCATSTISVSGAGGGSGTAATGAIMVANQGFVEGGGGFGIGQATVTADNVCLYQSAANQISGGIVWVQQ